METVVKFGLGIVLGGVLVLVGFVAWQQFGGFSSPVNITFPGMPVEREIDPASAPFALTLETEPSDPAAGQPVTITAQVQSKTSPHTRAVVKFYVDGQEFLQRSGVVPPFQGSAASYTWTASGGRHVVRAEVTSAAGVVYDSQEKVVEVRSQ